MPSLHSTPLFSLSRKSKDKGKAKQKQQDLDPSIDGQLIPLERLDIKHSHSKRQSHFDSHSDTMKFSHSLQFNSVPDWADKYVAYSNLKKAIYILEKDLPLEPSGSNHAYSDLDTESATLLEQSDRSETDKVFIPLLDKELEKISEFFQQKEKELQADLLRLKVDIENTETEEIAQGSDGLFSDEDDDDEELFDPSHVANGTSERRPSIDAVFLDPHRYNQASREERLLRGWEAASKSNQLKGHTSDEVSPSTQPLETIPPPMSPSQLIDHSPERDSGKRSRATSNASLSQRSSKDKWGMFTTKPLRRRRSAGLIHHDGYADRNAATGHEGGDALSAESKPTNIWVADNDYAIDMRITFKRRITDLFVAISELKQFAQLNETGMRKILKKYNKITKSNLKDKYLDGVVRTTAPFTREAVQRLEDCISTLVQLYAKVVTSGDVDEALQELKTHLREQVVWQRNTVWREMIGIERRAQGATLERTVMGTTANSNYEPEKPTQFRTPCGVITIPSWLSLSGFQLLVAFVVLIGLLKFPGLRFFPRVEEQNCLALLVFCTILWATEVIPLFVTSLMVPLLVVTLRVARDSQDQRMSAEETAKWIFSQMFAPNMYLLLGGFTLAAALSKYGIDKVLATKVLRLAGTRPSTVLLANMFVACFASMWISNVAAPVLMYSLIHPILRNLPPKSPYASSLIMGIALASNIGGQTSPIASPQNLIALQYMKQPVGWLQWFAITLPVSGLSLIVIWVILLWAYGSGRGTVIKRIGENKDSFTKIQWFISGVGVATILLWCLEKNFEWLVGGMGVVAIVPMILFFGTGILTKEDFNTFLWTVVFLAMGGIALGKAVTSSGLLESLDSVIQEIVEELPIWQIIIYLLVIGLIVATFISHTIAAVLLVPIAAQVGESLENPHPRLLIMATALVSSAAMGLPVSGFPNQIAVSMEDDLGDRYVTVKDFLRVGIIASIFSTLIVGTVGVVIMFALQF